MAEVTDYKKYTSALLMILFDRETLATHSVQGRRNTINGEDSQKPQLPPEILRSIIGKKESQRARSVHVCYFWVQWGTVLNHCRAFFFRSRVRQVRCWSQPNKDGYPHKVEQRGQTVKEKAGFGESGTQICHWWELRTRFLEEYVFVTAVLVCWLQHQIQAAFFGHFKFIIIIF